MSDTPVHLVLLLGASEFPELPRINSTEAFRNSADDIAAYFSEQNGPGVSHIKTLFDARESVIDQGFAIGDFLKEFQAEATDLIIYYIGHGGFLRQQDYYLTLRGTREGFESTTGLRVSSLAEIVKRHFTKRVYVILDCCFAGEALREFQTDTLSRVIETKTFREFPSSGTALLAASSKDDPAIAPNGARYTMFSGAMLEVLRTGIEKAGPFLSLETVADRIRNLINGQYGGDGVLPEVHSPKQEAGQPIARLPLFRNVASAAGKLPDEFAIPLGNPLPKVRAAAVESLRDLLAADGNNGLTALGLCELERLASADDSNLVRECAAKALAKLGVIGPADEQASVPVEPTPEPEPELEPEPEPAAEPVLGILVKPSQRRIPPNSQVTWTVTVTNDGQVPVQAVEVTDAAGTQLTPSFDLDVGAHHRIKFSNHYGDRGGKMTIAALGRTDDDALVAVEGVGRVSVRQPAVRPQPAATPSATPLLKVWENTRKPVSSRPPTQFTARPQPAGSLDLTQFRTALRQVKHTAKLGDATVNRFIRLIGEGEHHYRIATNRTARPRHWERQVVDWVAEVASVRSGDVIMVRLEPPSPGEIVENIDTLAAEVASATAVRIPTNEFPRTLPGA